ncbi:MAG TPA: GyrI-like domain-containing protein [Pedococcus sp.]|nr:GyrI-like domain-containing protein [Pedococcus sp.]
MGYDIEIAHESGRHLAVTRFESRVDEFGERMGAAFGTVAAYLGAAGVPFTGPAVARYEVLGDGAFAVAAGFVVEGPFEGGRGVEHEQLPVCDVARTVHVGPYDRLREAYEALGEGAASHGREIDESIPMWEEYLDGPEVPQEQTRTVVSRPLRPGAATAAWGLGG